MSRLPGYTLQKNQLNKQEWDHLIDSVDNPNLMQVWEYGEALHQLGWKVDRYLVFYGATLIAFFQCVSKRHFYSSVIKIQRGPLFLDNSMLSTHLAPVLSILRSKWTFWKLQFLQIEFELPLLPQYDVLVRQLGFRRTKNYVWESSKLDLQLSEEQLLANMRGNWRNALRNAMKNPIRITKSFNKEEFSWLVAQYDLYKNTHNMLGVSNALLYALYEQLGQNFHVLLAKTDDEHIISAVIIVSHGRAASYLLSWNSDLGRSMKANNLLLWQAIIDAKNRGEVFFDLGGLLSINDKYKAITDFKMGLGGEKYALLGEFY